MTHKGTTETYELMLAEKAQALIKNFQVNDSVSPNNKINVRFDGPDTALHTYDLDNDERFLHILEIDFVQGVEHIQMVIKEMLGRRAELILVKKPSLKFEDTGPYKTATTYQIPDDAQELLKYAYPKGLEEDYFFSFAFFGSVKDKISLGP